MSEPTCLHRLGEARRPLERPGHERREQRRVAADAVQLDASPRTDSEKPLASRSSDGTSRVASATASAERRAKPAEETRRSWSTRSVYAVNASPTTSSRRPLTIAIEISSVEMSSGPITGSVGPSQRSVPPPDDHVSGEITITPSALSVIPPR